VLSTFMDCFYPMSENMCVYGHKYKVLKLLHASAPSRTLTEHPRPPAAGWFEV
jgi:hypothetical protein